MAGLLYRRIGREEKQYREEMRARLRPFAARGAMTPSRPDNQLQRLGRDWRQPSFNRIFVRADYRPGRLVIADWRLLAVFFCFPGWDGARPCLQLARRGITIGTGGFADKDSIFPVYVSLHAVERFFRRAAEPTDFWALQGVHAVWRRYAERGASALPHGPFVVPDAGGAWRCEFAVLNRVETILVRTYVHERPG
jgi:hypothetical protein